MYMNELLHTNAGQVVIVQYKPFETQAKKAAISVVAILITACYIFFTFIKVCVLCMTL